MTSGFTQWDTGSHIKRILLLLSFLETLSTRVGNSHGSNQAFIQTDSELRYLVDGVATSFNEGIAKDSSGYDENPPGISVLGSPIRFEPPELDFNEQPVGLPVMRKIRVHNLNTESSIQMLSISGNTIHFHCSFFADKVIPPSGNTSFDIVFLGREEGLVENTLYIHTSAGSFRFQVRAMGMPNPYRLKPLVGVKMPLNSSYSPLIEMHNPHSEPIQVLEMYSSGGDLHLELPSGETEGPKTLWQIPPYQTKSVMKANFVARVENNHTAYIRIKTNTTGAEFLYLPLEVEVSSQPGIYCPQELIDFGLLASNSEPRSLKLLVLNSGQKPIPIQNVIATPVTEAVSINFQPVKISPDTLQPTMIADVIFDPSLVSGDGLYSGKLVIKSKNNQFKVTIPYRARVVSGRIFVDESQVRFHLRTETQDGAPADLLSRNLTLKNEFSVPVAVHNVSLAPAAARFFSLTPFQTVILGPGETRDVVILTLKPEAWKERNLDSYLLLHTNISNMNIPLICFHGFVETFYPGSPSQDILDYGTLGMGEKRDHYFTILNKNPVTINVKGWGSNLTGSVVEMMGVEAGGESHILQRSNFSGMETNMAIQPGHYMVFRISIQTPDEEGLTNGTVYIETDYHAFLLPFKFRVAKGSLHTVPRELIFDPVFPGKEVELKLKVFSSFTEDMITDSVYTIPRDARFSFRHAVLDGRTVVMSGEKSFIGRVIFDPSALCRVDESCYSGFTLTSKFGREWYQGLTLQPSIGDSDVAIVHTLWNRFKTANTPSTSFNITLNLDTNQVRGFLFKARARLFWPNIASKERVVFPLTQVGNFSLGEIVLTNPSSRDVYFHLVPMAAYPSGSRIASLLPSRFKTQQSVEKETVPLAEASVRTFRILSILDKSGSDPVPGIGDDLESRYGVLLHPDTKAFILSPGRTVKVAVRFQPDIVGKFNQGIFVRNNLTGMDMIELRGESVEGELKFGKWKSGQTGTGILEFDMKEKHLRDCDRSKHSRYSPPVLTVKRSFKLKNTGQTSVIISGFDVEGQACEGYGFKVLNCEPTTLEPLQSLDIDIAFTPDFTLSKVNRILTLHTSLSPEKRRLHFNLQATVPAHMLFICASILPRPSWEPYLFYIINTFMIFILVCVTITAVMEAERILKLTIGVPLHTRAHLLDLRRVAEEVDNDMKQRIASRDEADKSTPASPQSKPLEKPLLLSRLASRCLQFLFMPVQLATSFVRRSFANMRKRQQLSRLNSSHPDEIEEIEEDEDLEDGDDGVEEDGEEDGDDEGSIPDRSQQEPKESEVVSSVATGRQHRSRKRGRQNQRPKATGPGDIFGHNRVADDADSSSTCTESSLLDEENREETTSTGSSVRNCAKGKNKKNRIKENNSHSVTSEATVNANSIKNSNKNSNSQPQISASISSSNKKEKVTKKLSQEQTTPPTASKPTVTATEDNSVKAATKNNNVAETSNKKSNKNATTNATKATANQQTTAVPAQAPKKAVKQQANVKPNEKPPRLNIKSLSESEDKVENCSTPQTPGGTTPGLVINGSGSTIFGGSSFNNAPTPLAPSDALKQRIKVAPVGKILPEIKKPENLGAQFGPIGAKPPTMMAGANSGRKSTWIDSPAEPRNAMLGSSSVGSNLGRMEPSLYRTSSVDGPAVPLASHSNDHDLSLRYQQQQQQQQLQQQQASMFNNQRLLNIDELTGGLGISSGLMEAHRRGVNSSPTHSTLMQTLQYERRQRTEEFFSQQQSEWPGFGTQQPTDSYLENLWDTPPTEPLRTSLSSGWGNFSNIWPSSLWGTGLGSSTPTIIDPLPTYNLSSAPQETANSFADAESYADFSSVWGGSPKRQPQGGPAQQPQQQQSGQYQQQQGQGGLNSSWSSTLFSKHPHQE